MFTSSPHRVIGTSKDDINLILENVHVAHGMQCNSIELFRHLTDREMSRIGCFLTGHTYGLLEILGMVLESEQIVCSPVQV